MSVEPHNICGLCFIFFFNDTATTEIYTLSLHDALPIFSIKSRGAAATKNGHDKKRGAAATRIGQ